MNDRAVSDIVGFVLSFAIIMASVAVVSTVGFSQLEDVRETEEIKSAEQGMIELAESFSPLHRGSDTTRRAGLALSGGTLELQQSKLTITAGGTSKSMDLWGLEHRINDIPVTYEGGAVFYGKGAVVSHRPAISCQDNDGTTVVVVSLLSFKPDEFYIARGTDRIRLPSTEGMNMNDQHFDITSVDVVSDEGRVVLSATRTKSDVLFQQSLSGTPVTVDFSDTATPEGWKRYGDRGDSGWSLSGETLTCSSVDRVLVRKTTVEIDLSGR